MIFVSFFYGKFFSESESDFRILIYAKSESDFYPNLKIR